MFRKGLFILKFFSLFSHGLKCLNFCLLTSCQINICKFVLQCLMPNALNMEVFCIFLFFGFLGHTHLCSGLPLILHRRWSLLVRLRLMLQVEVSCWVGIKSWKVFVCSRRLTEVSLGSLLPPCLLSG